MTTNQMVKLFSKILKDAKPVELSAKTKAQLKDICDTVKNLK